MVAKHCLHLAEAYSIYGNENMNSDVMLVCSK